MRIVACPEIAAPDDEFVRMRDSFSHFLCCPCVGAISCGLPDD